MSVKIIQKNRHEPAEVVSGDVVPCAVAGDGGETVYGTTLSFFAVWWEFAEMQTTVEDP